jgi:phosphoadenosine phosphosulfate reductase
MNGRAIAAATPHIPHELDEAAERLDRARPEEILEWAIDRYQPDLVMATGFGPSGTVLLHMALQLWERPRVFYLDTDLLFPETYQLRDELEARFGVNFERVHGGTSVEEQARLYGEELWAREPDTCCYLRKVLPLRRYLSDKQAWITGIRRDQSPSRRHTQVVSWDSTNRVVKLSPLASWTDREVWTYLHVHDLPYNPLHDVGYPSIGCLPCTQSVTNGADPRSGRWSGHAKLECGIHR